ncbi:MAG: hypothetical protein U1E59_15155 [Amaricoccus sp.]
MAAVFSKDGRVGYIEKAPGFPGTLVWASDSLSGLLPPRRKDRSLTTLDPVDPSRWLKWAADVELFAQTFYQADGYAVTLLVAERDEDLESNERTR